MTALADHSGPGPGPAGDGRREAVLAWVREAGRPFFLPVAGTSMTPLLRPGDRVRVAPVGPEILRAGDVAVFRAVTGTVVHRLIGREKGAPFRFLQKGDSTADWSWVLPGDVLGRVDRVECAGGAAFPLAECPPWRARAGCLAWRLYISVGGRRGRPGPLGRRAAAVLNRLFFRPGRPRFCR